MTAHALVLASAGGVSTQGWWLGYTLGFLVLLVVIMLVVPILLLAHGIGKQASQIDESLKKSVENTAPLAALRTTIVYATTIIAGLQRGRARLGG
jgi:ABC-type sulfate transport system permease component